MDPKAIIQSVVNTVAQTMLPWRIVVVVFRRSEAGLEVHHAGNTSPEDVAAALAKAASDATFACHR